MSNRLNTVPSYLLRLEGALVLILGIVLYRELDASWWMFVLLFLVPDLALFGYLVSREVGVTLYNLVHTYAVPIVLFGFGFATEGTALMGIAFIWAAHIGIDRMLGFGLKYTDAFRETHLQKVAASSV